MVVLITASDIVPSCVINNDRNVTVEFTLRLGNAFHFLCWYS